MLSAAEADTQSHHADQRIKQARTLLQKGQYADAITILEKFLKTDANNSRALYMLAVCQRYLKQTNAAFETLSRLKAVSPGYARAYQEEGHAHRLLNDSTSAITAYEMAVSINPGLHASWKALGNLYRTSGAEKAAERAEQYFLRLAKMPVELASVTSMIYEDKLLKAEQLCRSFLQGHPHHPEAMRLLAKLGTLLYVLDDAEFLLESCLEFSPEFHEARYDYIRVLHQRQKYEKALAQAKRLCSKCPGNPAYEAVMANAQLAVGEVDTALGLYESILAKHPKNHGIHLARAHALKTTGQVEDAVLSYRAAFGAKPDFGDAFWSLANLKTYRFSDAELDQMRSLEQATETSLTDRFHLCFALGKAFEDRRDYAASFAYYERGNKLKRVQLPYSAERIEAAFRAQMHCCDHELFSDRKGQGCQSAAPVFIVGLPRAGSTLLEQVLASHSQVEGTLELSNILALAHRLNGRRTTQHKPGYPEILRDLSADKLRQFGEDYIRDTRIHRGSAPFFIDKMPNNFRHIGLIHLILPNAKIIDARRNSMACCFSGFKQLFAEGQEFSYDLEEIGRYYRAYVELMDYWDKLLPGRILRVHYEDVVADLDLQLRRILEFCQLPYEQGCLNFHETRRLVRTASSEQVRQPIYHDAIDQWRNFHPYLNPLKKALQGALPPGVE